MPFPKRQRCEWQASQMIASAFGTRLLLVCDCQRDSGACMSQGCSAHPAASGRLGRGRGTWKDSRDLQDAASWRTHCASVAMLTLLQGAWGRGAVEPVGRWHGSWRAACPHYIWRFSPLPLHSHHLYNILNPPATVTATRDAAALRSTSGAGPLLGR